MTTDALKTARQQVDELEKTMFADIQAKAELLGYTLTKSDEATAPATKQKRKRRTKAEIQAAAQERVE